MSKTMLVVATVAMLGLSSAAFADNAAPVMKEGVQPTHPQVSVTHKKRLSHRVGARNASVAYRHNPHHQIGTRIKLAARKACQSMQLPTRRWGQKRPPNIASEVRVEWPRSPGPPP